MFGGSGSGLIGGSVFIPKKKQDLTHLSRYRQEVLSHTYVTLCGLT